MHACRTLEIQCSAFSVAVPLAGLEATRAECGDSGEAAGPLSPRERSLHFSEGGVLLLHVMCASVNVSKCLLFQDFLDVCVCIDEMEFKECKL